jgi:hypothetical protein
MAFVLSGCSRADRSELDILPQSDRARTALDTALTAWKNGEKIGSLKGDAYTIQVADRAWTAGKKLTAYEILGSVDKPGPRWFTVRLTMAGAQPKQMHYAVFGMDPLQVFSEPDYNQMCGMGEKSASK